MKALFPNFIAFGEKKDNCPYFLLFKIGLGFAFFIFLFQHEGSLVI